MIRVAHVLVAGDVDGIGMHVLDLANAQARSGRVDPVLVTSPSQPYGARLTEVDFSVVTLPAAVRAHPTRTLTRLGARMGDVDVLHLHGYRVTRLLPRLRRSGAPLWVGPVVATCHGFVPADLRRQVRTRLDIRGLRRSDAVIGVSPPLARRLRGAMPPTTAVVAIPNGVPLPVPGAAAHAQRVVRASLGVADGCTVVMFAGRLVPEKRPDLFVEVAEKVLSRRDDVHFALIGDGPERSQLQARAHRQNLGRRLTFVGMVLDAPTWIAGASVLLHPSDHEATPRAVIEAMAAGVPVAATDVGGVPYVLGVPGDRGIPPAGLVSRRGNVDGLLSNTVALVDDPGLRVRLGRAGRLRASEFFSIDLMARQVYQTYAEVLDRRVHPGLVHG